MNKKHKIILVLLIVIFAISSFFLIKEIAENKKENEIYEDLQEIVLDNGKSTHENDTTEILKNEASNISNENSTNSYNTYNLETIKKINSEVIGWLKIGGTNIDYPVMQNGDFYLYKNIYKDYSKHGTPYLADYCNLENSDNLIIYGHNMKDRTMFSQLEKYKDYNFYLHHKYIKLYTVENDQTIENNYEIIFVIKTVAYSDKEFKYYNYINFYDEEEFNDFTKKCNDLKLYDTGVDLNYGDKLMTLSTCEYSQENGRLLVIGRKI